MITLRQALLATFGTKYILCLGNARDDMVRKMWQSVYLERDYHVSSWNKFRTCLV